MIRQYAFIHPNDLHSIDFDHVLETNHNTCRINSDGSETFVKFAGDVCPQCLENVNHVLRGEIATLEYLEDPANGFLLPE